MQTDKLLFAETLVKFPNLGYLQDWQWPEHENNNI